MPHLRELEAALLALRDANPASDIALKADDKEKPWTRGTNPLEWRGVAIGGTEEDPELIAINLSDTKVTELPKHVMMYFGSLLRSAFDISCNEFAELPAEITCLKAIRGLNLAMNKLTSLPAALGEFKNLTHLNLEINEIKELPEPLVVLTELKALLASHNKLKAVPTEIGNLKNLEIISLGNNGILTVPESLGKCEGLIYLYLNNNAIEDIPESLNNLTNLKELYINHNKLSHGVPKLNLTRFAKLRVFWSLDNGMTKGLPYTIADLPDARELDVSRGNPACDTDARWQGICEALRERRVSVDGKNNFITSLEPVKALP